MVNKKKAKKKVAKKVSKKTAAAAALPQSSNIPSGMKQMGGGYAATWKPEEIGDSLHGVISAAPRELTLNKGTKKENVTQVMEVTDMEGERHGVWHSAVLGSLFDALAELGEDAVGVEVFIEYAGLGKKKPGQNPAKLFNVATNLEE